MSRNRIWYLTNHEGNHKVQVCQDNVSQAEAVTLYIKEGLLNNEGVIVFAKPALRKAVISNLDTQGLDIKTFKEEGQIKFFDAEFLVSNLLIDGVLEKQLFNESVEIPIQTLKSKYGRIHVFGGMVNTLWKNGQYNSAMQLESMWVDLSRREEFTLLCSYSLEDIDSITYDVSLEHIFEFHSHLTPLKNHDFSETLIGAAATDVFWATWNRVIEKLECNPKREFSSDISQRYLQH